MFSIDLRIYTICRRLKNAQRNSIKEMFYLESKHLKVACKQNEPPPIKSLICVFHLKMGPGEFHTNVLSLKVQQGIHIMHI